MLTASSNYFSLAFLLAFLPWVLANLALPSDNIFISSLSMSSGWGSISRGYSFLGSLSRSPHPPSSGPCHACVHTSASLKSVFWIVRWQYWWTVLPAPNRCNDPPLGWHQLGQAQHLLIFTCSTLTSWCSSPTIWTTSPKYWASIKWNTVFL